MNTLNTLHSIDSISRKGRFFLLLILLIPPLLFHKPLSADSISSDFESMILQLRKKFLDNARDDDRKDPCRCAALNAAQGGMFYVVGEKWAWDLLGSSLDVMKGLLSKHPALAVTFDAYDIYDALATGEGGIDFLKGKAIEQIGDDNPALGKALEFVDNLWSKIQEELDKQKDETVEYTYGECPIVMVAAWDKSRRNKFPDFGPITIYVAGDCECRTVWGVKMKEFQVSIFGRAHLDRDSKKFVVEYERYEVQANCDCPEERQTSLGDAVGDGAIAMAILGRDKTTAMAMRLGNKTDTHMNIVVPTGTPLEPGSKDHQPYQTGYIPPIELGPGETETVEVPAFCTDSEKEPAPADGSVAYTLHEGPLTPKQEKITEIIVVTNTLRQLHETCGKVAEPDDFLVVGGPPRLRWQTSFPPPLRLKPKVYGPPPPPTKPEPEVTGLTPVERLYWMLDIIWYYRLEPPSEPVIRDYLGPGEEYDPLAPEPGPFFPEPESFVDDPFDPRRYPPSAPEPALPRGGLEGIPKPPPGPPEFPPRGRVPYGSLLLSLSGPLEFPGTTQFTLAEVPELKTNISSRKEKGEAVFSNPAGKVEVSMAPTEDPEIVKFNITKLEARAPSFKALDKSRGDINVALNSPEKSTGTLNIKTGEVKGTVSVKAWGKKYKEPFPAAASYTGRFDFPTKKLSLNLRGTSFEPVDMEEGLYQRIKPEKFWDSVMLYSIWKETNDQGKEELRKVMTEQLRADFPKERAEGLSALVAEEIVHRVDEVHERHKKLKKEEADFSILDPTLKLRKT